VPDMRALEQWSFDEAIDAHRVIDALDRFEAKKRREARAKAEERKR